MAKNATPQDARAGFDIYRKYGGAIDRDGLNRELEMNGYGPVSDRMMTHYSHLLNSGYNRYISINRFDVARAASRHGDIAASPRYPVYEGDESVRVLIAKRNRLWTATAQVAAVGEAGVVLQFLNTKFADGLAKIKLRKGDEVSLYFVESSVEEAGRVAEVDLGAKPPLVEVQFNELISLAELSGSDSAPTATLGLRLRTSDDEESPTTDQLSRRLFLAFELVDEFRAIANFVLMGDHGGNYSPPAVVEQLSVTSPPEFWLEVSEIVKSLVLPGTITFVLRQLAKVPEMRKIWLEGDLLKDDKNERRAAREARQAKKEADAAVAELAHEITEILSGYRKMPVDARTRTQSVIEDRVGRVLALLVESGIDEIDVLPRNLGQKREWPR